MGMAIHRTELIDVSLPLPVYLRATGWYNAARGWVEANDGKNREHAGLFWCMDGCGSFTINGDKHNLETGQLVYYLPREPHFIDIDTAGCTYYWVTFDGCLAEALLRSFRYPREPFYSHECLIAYFDEFFEILHDFTPAGLQRGSLALYRFLVNIGDRAAVPHSNVRNVQLTESFVKLVGENFANREFNVNTAADILKVHRTTLGRALNEQLKITPGSYITNIRLQRALRMLYETDLRAQDIADACGIPDPCYFSKLVRRFTGLPPGKLRYGSM